MSGGGGCDGLPEVDVKIEPCDVTSTAPPMRMRQLRMRQYDKNGNRITPGLVGHKGPVEFSTGVLVGDGNGSLVELHLDTGDNHRTAP